MQRPADRARTLFDYVERSQRVDDSGTILPPQDGDPTPIGPVASPVELGNPRSTTDDARWFDGRQPALERYVAVQVPRTTSDAAAVLGQARVIARLAHPNVAPAYAVDGDGRVVYRRQRGSRWCDLLERPHDVLALAQGRDAVSFHLDVWSEVAGTIAWAHAREVAHGSLGAEHVRVGQHGEVQVGGWHLARVDPEAPPDAGSDLAALADLLEHLCDGLHPEGEEALREVAQRPAAGRLSRVVELDAAVQRWRSRRGAHRLRAEGDVRAARLRAHLDGTEIDPVFVERVGSEARFAYREALEIWPEDPAAREGRARLLRSLVRYHCGRGQPRPARALLAELGPEPELEARVTTVEEGQLVEQAEIGALRRFESSESTRGGALLRAVSGVVLALCAWTLCMALGFVDAEWGVAYPVATLGLASFTAVAAALAGLVYAFARSRANLRQLGVGAATLGMATVAWLLCQRAGAPIADALSLHALVAAAVLGAGAWGVDRSLTLAPVVYLGAAITIASGWPHPWLQFGLGNALAMLSYSALSAIQVLRPR